jgi:hypothetical protein
MRAETAMTALSIQAFVAIDRCAVGVRCRRSLTRARRRSQRRLARRRSRADGCHNALATPRGDDNHFTVRGKLCDDQVGLHGCRRDHLPASTRRRSSVAIGQNAQVGALE